MADQPPILPWPTVREVSAMLGSGVSAPEIVARFNASVSVLGVSQRTSPEAYKYLREDGAWETYSESYAMHALGRELLASGVAKRKERLIESPGELKSRLTTWEVRVIKPIDG